MALHDRAVWAAMSELEKFATTRVRAAGAQANRETGNVIGAAFRHDTSRELDPHLHTHCVVLNATFDPAEKRWKAIKTQGMYAAKKFAQDLYYHYLTKGPRKLGCEVKNNVRDFEIKGVPASVSKRFSKRHQQIDEEASRLTPENSTHPKMKAVRKQVARAERKRKQKSATASKLRPLRESQMTPAERTALANLNPTKHGRLPSTDVPAVVAWADEHLFARKSVISPK